MLFLSSALQRLRAAGFLTVAYMRARRYTHVTKLMGSRRWPHVATRFRISSLALKLLICLSSFG